MTSNYFSENLQKCNFDNALSNCTDSNSNPFLCPNLSTNETVSSIWQHFKPENSCIICDWDQNISSKCMDYNFLSPSLGNFSYSINPEDRSNCLINTDRNYKITDELSFNGVKPGNLVFFAHLNKLTHLFISKAQEYLGFGDQSTHNVTHVGIVTDVNKDSIKVSEIPGYGKFISEKEYHLKDLYKYEELLFSSTPSCNSKLNDHIAKLGKVWGTHKNSQNQYNLKGLLEIPIKSDIFNEKDKNTVLNNFIDSRYLQRLPHEIQGNELQPKSYFCSEFAVQIEQLARFETEMRLPSTLDQQIMNLKLDTHDGRAQALEILKKYTDEANVWEKLGMDPLYKLSSEHTTPSSLLSTAISLSNVVRVRNPNAEDRFGEAVIPKNKLPAYTEFTATKVLDRYLDGEQVQTTDKDIQKFLKTLEDQGGYSKDTLTCFLDKLPKNTANSLQSCLETTLSWKEKLIVYMFSRQLNRATDQLLHNPVFIDFLNKPSKENLKKIDLDSLDFSVDSYLDTSFPSSYGGLVSKIENYFVKNIVKNLDKATLLKYMPIAAAYSPPTETMDKFVKESHINTVSLALKMHEFLSFVDLGHKTYNGKSNGIEFLWNGLSRLGWLQKDNLLVKNLIDKFSLQTGYSKETLNCIADKAFAQTFNPSVVETCLKDTLTASEKINIASTSHFINVGVENLLKNDDFRASVRTGAYNPLLEHLSGPNKEAALLELFFTSNEGGLFNTAQNYLAKSYLSSSLKNGIPQFLLKDLFLGLSYDNPSEAIQKFLKEEGLTKEDFIIKIAKWVSL